MTRQEIIENLESKRYQNKGNGVYVNENTTVELLRNSAIITRGKLVKIRIFGMLEKIDF